MATSLNAPQVDEDEAIDTNEVRNWFLFPNNTYNNV
jgi:hypothetical protein